MVRWLGAVVTFISVTTTTCRYVRKRSKFYAILIRPNQVFFPRAKVQRATNGGSEFRWSVAIMGSGSVWSTRMKTQRSLLANAFPEHPRSREHLVPKVDVPPCTLQIGKLLPWPFEIPVVSVHLLGTPLPRLDEDS